jgi:hypothetical protein
MFGARRSPAPGQEVRGQADYEGVDVPKRIAALAAVLVLTLTGCAGTADDAGVERTAPAASESAAPLVAETPEETPAPASEDAQFLERARDYLPDDTVIPNATDEQLLIAAQAACEQMNSGIDSSAVDVIEGEQPNGLEIRESSAAIAVAAKETYCPQGY